MPKNLNRLLSWQFTQWLVKTPLTPNLITLLGAANGIAAGFLFQQDSYLANVMGGFLFELYALLDNCDGEIAHLKNMRSTFGSWLDIGSDAVVHIWIYFCFLIWVTHYHPSSTWAGITALIGMVMTFTLSLIEKTRGSSLTLKPTLPLTAVNGTHPLSLREWILLNQDAETFPLLVLIVILLCLKLPFLWLTAVGINLFWIRSWLTLQKPRSN